MTNGNESTTSQIIKWASGQPFNNVLLMTILASFGWACWHGITTAIPSHLKQIQAGYESLDDKHTTEREQSRLDRITERKLLVETYDKWFERISGSNPTLAAP